MSEPKVTTNYRPSNGTEGCMMRAQTCDRCEVDHDWHRHNAGMQDQPDESCPILMRALIGDEPVPEWSRNWDEGTYACTGFVRCNCGRGGPPPDDKPKPPPPKALPGQLDIFDPRLGIAESDRLSAEVTL